MATMTTKTLGDVRSDVRGRLDDPTFDTLKLDEFANEVLEDIFSRAVFSFEPDSIRMTDATSVVPLPTKSYEIVVLGTYQKCLEWNDDYDYAGVIERQYEQKLGRMIATDMNNADDSENVGDANDVNIFNWTRPEI